MSEAKFEQLVANDPRLEQILEQVRDRKEEALRFAADPEGYLKARGVETAGMKFGAAELSEAELDLVAGGTAAAEPTGGGICAAIGSMGVCVSIGN